jgi:chorismate--pyruvate lyase
MRAWLDARGSLTRQLTSAFGPVEVQVLSQRTAPVDRVVRERLRRSIGRPIPIARCHVREVVLWAGDEPLVHARSVLPAVQTGLAWRAVRGLGTRPLADLLFGLRAVPARRLGAERLEPWPARRLEERLHRQCARISAGAPPADIEPMNAGQGPVQPHAVSQRAWHGRPIWCRHTAFIRRGVPLLITEWFAPGVARRAPITSAGSASRRIGKACDRGAHSAR